MSGASYTSGQVLTAQSLNASLNAKVDASNAQITGGQITGVTTVDISGTTDSTSPSTGALVVAGGAGVGESLQVGGNVTVGNNAYINSPTQSVSTTTGALVVAGGAGIADNVNIGGSVTVGGSVSAQQASVQSTTDSTSANNGALVVAGGAGVAKTLNVGGSANVAGALNVTGATTVSGLLEAANVTLLAGGEITFADGSTQTTAASIDGETLINSTGGTVNISLASANASNVFKVTGALSSNLSVVFPVKSKPFTVYNGTTGAYSVTCTVTGQTPSVSVAQGYGATMFTDSTGCYSSSSSSLTLPLGVSNGGTGATTAPAAAHNLGLGSTDSPSFASVTAVQAAVNTFININASAGQYRELVFESTGLPRWAVGAENSSESGSNAGSNFIVARYNDAGNPIDNPISVNRQTGIATFLQTPAFPNQSIGNNSTNGANTAFVQTAVSPFSGENRFINGACRIAQRGDQTHAAGTGTYSAVDRFLVNTTGSSVTSHQSAASIGASNSNVALQITGATGNTGVSVVQRIESGNISDLALSSVTVSFYIDSSVAFTPVMTAYTPNAADNWSGATTAVSGIPALGALTANTWTKYTVTFSLPAAAANGLAIVFNLSSLGSGQNIYMTQFKLEAGSIATPFATRSLETELKLCQRYFETGQQPFRYISGLAGVVYAYDCVYFKATKRAAPTLTGSGFQYYSSGSNTACTPTFSSWIDMLGFQCSGLTNWQGWAGTGTWAATSEL